MDPGRRARATEAINQRLVLWAMPKSSSTIAVYAGVGSEVSLQRAVDTWLLAGHRVVWPRLGSNYSMGFHAARPGELELGPYGISQPQSHVNPVDPSELDIIFVPGIAFTRFGSRLGQGGGYYDRYFGGMVRLPETVGVAFALQIVPKIPTTQTDVPVSAVVTEQGVSRMGRWSV